MHHECSEKFVCSENPEYYEICGCSERSEYPMYFDYSICSERIYALSATSTFRRHEHFPNIFRDPFAGISVLRRHLGGILLEAHGQTFFREPEQLDSEFREGYIGPF